MDKISHIMVPINGSPTDEVALSLAEVLVKRNTARVSVIHVVEVKRALPVDADLPTETLRGEQLLDWALEQAQHLKIKIDVDLLQARSAGVALVNEATAIKADVIILGVPYRANFGTFRLSETSNYVLSHAACRVWLVRAPQQMALEADV